MYRGLPVSLHLLLTSALYKIHIPTLQMRKLRRGLLTGPGSQAKEMVEPLLDSGLPGSRAIVLSIPGGLGTPAAGGTLWAKEDAGVDRERAEGEVSEPYLKGLQCKSEAFGLHGKKAMEKQCVNCTGKLRGHPAPWENGSHSECWVCCRAATLA